MVVDLNGKTAFVTGGSGEIGSAIVERLSAEGAAVAAGFFENAEKAHSLVNRLAARGARALAVQVDVLSRESVLSAFSETVQRFDRLDVLVNSAGINQPTDFDRITDDAWDQVLATNLKGPFICSQIAIDIMKATGGGSIVNIGSISGQYGGPRTGHYAASKAGLISLGQVVARFSARHRIRCNTVAVGLIESDMARRGLNSNLTENIREQILLGRLGTREEVAEVVTFLASDRSSYITGQTIGVNGGLYF